MYIEPVVGSAGTIKVFLDSPSGTLVATFTDSSNSITSLYGGITFHDQSSAYDKQGMTITFSPANTSTLEVDAGENDTEIDETKSGADVTVTVTDPTDDQTGTDIYNSGIDTLHIVTNDAGGATVDVTNCLQTVIIDTGAGTNDTIIVGGIEGENEGYSVPDSTINTGAGNDTVTLNSADDDTFDVATVDFGNNPGGGNTLNVNFAQGTAYLATPQAIDTVNIANGLVQLDQSGRWNTNTFGTISFSGGGQLDLGAQEALVTGMSDADVRAIIANAYNFGSWNGNGITSTYAIDVPSEYAVGYATYGDNGTTGLDLSSGQVLIRPTRVGDANLNGTTDLTDYNKLAINYNHTGTDWAQGDFDYDGTTGLADYNLLAANFNDSFPT